MKGRFRIWTWGHPAKGGAGQVPVELDGLRNCEWERAKVLTQQLDSGKHYAVWTSNDGKTERPWGSESLKIALVWNEGSESENSRPPSVASLDDRRANTRRPT